MTENKRFHFDYVCGDTGLIDEKAELKWFIENCCSIQDLKDNWKTVCDKLNELNEENEKLKQENHDIKHKIEELYYTYIYEPSENYDEDSCDKIIRGIINGVEKDD